MQLPRLHYNMTFMNQPVFILVVTAIGCGWLCIQALVKGTAHPKKKYFIKKQNDKIW